MKDFRAALAAGRTKFDVGATVEWDIIVFTLDPAAFDLEASDEDLQSQLQEYLETNIETPIIYKVR